MKSSISLMPISHRSVLTIAVPIMLSNVTEPLIGVVNTAVIGQLPEAYYIGAISIGSLIFSFLFGVLAFSGSPPAAFRRRPWALAIAPR